MVGDSDEGVSDGHWRRLTLIRAVRSLDEDSTIPIPDKIHQLWLLLSATKKTRLHGVEESILRWLFHQMSGDADRAEHVRRYPLTWTILSHVFPKIPPQALGRSLSYLRFVSVLQRVIADITTASHGDNDTPQTRKRKRDDGIPSDIDDLRTPQGCMKSATALFAALNCLFTQGGQHTESSALERRIGAEHIKSLFSSSSQETKDIAAKLLLTCDRSLSVLEAGICQDQESWIRTITTLWSFRLHSNYDSCSILTRLRGITGVAPVQAGDDTVKALWIRQLGQLIGAYFIRPARRMFSTDKTVEAVREALEASKRNIGGSAIVIWEVAARTPKDSSDPKSKAEHSSWTQTVFETLLDAVKHMISLDRNIIVAQLLDIAMRTNAVPNTEILRRVCREHVLSTHGIDWDLISKIVACDADVFLMDDALMKDLFSRLDPGNSGLLLRENIVSKAILPLQDAFAKARNLSGFIQKWHNCLCKRAKDSLDQSTWFDPRIREQLASILESSLTGTQLLRVLESINSSDADIGALLIIFDGISAGIAGEEFVNHADSQMFSVVCNDRGYKKLPSPVVSLRWRIAGRMAAWETSDEVDRLWVELKSPLKRILKKGALTEPATFEAFSCCHKLWLANHPGGGYESRLAKLTSLFLERLVSATKAQPDFSTLRPYVDYVFRYLPKLTELSKREDDGLRNLIVDLFLFVERQFSIESDLKLSTPLRSLLHNYDFEDDESLLDALISHPLNDLDGAEAQPGWTQPRSLSLLMVLLEFPREAWTKARRKRVMSSLKKWRSEIASRASKDEQFAVAVLRLMIQGMAFDDLIYISSAMATQNRLIHALVEKLIDLTLRQMVTGVEGPSQTYLRDASKYVKDLKLEGENHQIAHLLLVKALLSALHSSSPNNPYRSVVTVDEISQKLGHLVQENLTRLASKGKPVEEVAETESRLLEISAALSGAACLAEDRREILIELPEQIILQLEDISTSCVSRGVELGWKLRGFLLRNHPDRYDMESLLTQLDQASRAIDENLVYDLVDSFIRTRDRAAKDQLLGELVGSNKLTKGPIGPLLAVRRLVEHQGYGASLPDGGSQYVPDLGTVHERLASLLSEAESLRHFKQLADIIVILLDKHANLMTQFNIDATIGSVVKTCSQTGPNIQGPRVAGDIYDKLYRIVAVVLKRHRLRLGGHFPILIAGLRALLSTLLMDPHSSSANTASLDRRPPWLESRLQPRHAERFARLVTLVCEPSAASVARSRSSELESAIDVAKRVAGQDMFIVLQLYIKLQLEVSVPRGIRKALEPGVYSILDITPQGCRRVLNESLGANGRAIFRQMFADYTKFGKWNGI
ncbi:Urb2/Npa2 family-domain-containing protein [Durotheca rogersii]|uniref:Urb2/Npa2 family-domain-containing protein n=1 Tax=Durotheca rogersii TaxID=419775 RepID=UPI00221E909B|nr:Urb2/Npa2 family-domain-containing protein [Durotheca rogersii]KAI5863206.1 Urb2/Npa2 family-domain-containing protein [Durotheca rogersii]